MTTTQQLVVGIFQDQTQAELAIDELVRAGFERHQIDFAGPRPAASTGGVLEQIKSLFTGQDASADWLYSDLMNMGVPPEETRYFQSEFEAGHSIVAVHGTVGLQMASLIMARNGGYGPNRSTTQSAHPDQETAAPQSNQENVNPNPETGAPQSNQENVNPNPETAAPQSNQENVNPNPETDAPQPNQEDVNREPRRPTL